MSGFGLAPIKAEGTSRIPDEPWLQDAIEQRPTASFVNIFLSAAGDLRHLYIDAHGATKQETEDLLLEVHRLFSKGHKIEVVRHGPDVQSEVEFDTKIERHRGRSRFTYHVAQEPGAAA